MTGRAQVDGTYQQRHRVGNRPTPSEKGCKTLNLQPAKVTLGESRGHGGKFRSVDAPIRGVTQGTIGREKDYMFKEGVGDI